MNRVLKTFVIAGAVALGFSLSVSAAQVITFSGENAAGDCYADGTPLLAGECYAIVWQREGTEFAGFNADGSVVDPENCEFVKILAGSTRGAKRGTRGGVAYAYCPAYSVQVPGDLVEKYEYQIALYAFDTRIWKDGQFVVGGTSENLMQINSYAKIMDLDVQSNMGPVIPSPQKYVDAVSVSIIPRRVEKLVFRTLGNDCFVEGSVTSSVAKGECYALVWKRNASVSPEFTFASPEPAVTVTGTEDYWFAGYYPVAQNDGTKAWCPDVTIEAGALPFAFAKGGVWSVYLLNTRDPKRDGTVTCGFDPTVANKPNHIIAFAPVPGLTDFTLRVTDNPAVSADKTATAATVADRQTAKPQLEIVCNGNGGTPASQTISLAWGAKIGSGGLVPVTRTGYSLTGWAVTDTGRTVDASTPLYFNDPLEARWTANSYSVAFDANGGTGTMGPQNLQYDQSQALSPNRFARPGYGFAGWATSVSGPVVYSDGASVKNLTASSGGRVTLYAVWTARVNTVTFDANGGATSEASRSVKTDAKVGALPTATRLGYTFAGWFTACTGGDRVTADSIVRTSVTYYARWTANSYTIDFNERGGSGAMADQPMVWDEAAALYANQFTRVGYTFLGWTDDEDELCEVLFYDGFVVSNLTDVAGGEYDLYAVWAANKYEVVFDKGGGEGEMKAQAFVYDQDQPLSPNQFVRTDWGFMGWALTDDGEVVYDNCETVSNLTAETGGRVTLYAIWKSGVSTVTFDVCGGNVTEHVRRVKKGERLGTLPAAELVCHRFLGWFTAPEGGSKVTAETVVTNDQTLYAQWAGFDPDDPKSDWLKIRIVQEEVSLDIGEPVGAAEEYFTFDTGSALKSVKVSGLPTGVTFKFTEARGEKPAELKLAGAAKKKGIFYVTVTATNADKFSQTSVMKFVVGGAASDEKDEIGKAYGIDFSALSKLAVGTTLRLDALLLPSSWKITAKGLPTGLKVVKSCAKDASGVLCDAVQGTPTKPGKFAVAFTMKDLKNPRVILTTKMDIVVGDPSSKYITVVAEAGGSTSTKSGVYVAGSTLKLSATAAKKNVFVGWRDDAGELVLPPAGADYRAGSLSMIVGEATSTRFTACYADAADDRDIAVTTIGFDSEKEGVTDVLVCRTAAAPQDFWFKVDSLSLPKISLKGLPSGVSFAGVKDIALGGEGMPGCLPDEQYYRIRVKDGSKLKPGVYMVQFNVGNASQKQAVVKAVTIEVPNIRSGLYEGQLNYDKGAYPIVAGIEDLTKYPAFNAPANAKVSVKGLPAGIKFDSKGKTFTGVATKAGSFTVTITTTVGKTKYVDTVTLSVSGLPSQLVGTFNGLATNEIVMATEAVTITASAVGKITAKVGTVSLTKTGWDSFEDGEAKIRLEKSSGKGQTAVMNTLDLCVNTNGWWKMQVGGSYSVCGSQTADYGVFAQRNPFGKSGRVYENEDAHELAAWLSKQGSGGKFTIRAVKGSEPGVWQLDEADDGSMVVQIADAGTVKLSGKLGGGSVSGSTVLAVLDEDLLAADFVIGKDAKKVVLRLALEISQPEGTILITGSAQSAAE